MAASGTQNLDGSFPAAYSKWGPSCPDPFRSLNALESGQSLCMPKLRSMATLPYSTFANGGTDGHEWQNRYSQPVVV